jgi:phage terminase large subunit-like protein
MASVTVEPFIRSLAWQYNVQAVAMDPWQAYQMAQQLQASGVPVIMVNQNKTAHGRAVCDTALWTLARNQELVLYDHPELVKATSYASAEDLPDGKNYIKKRGRYGESGRG